MEVYSCRRRTGKWTTNSFFYLLDVAAYNALALCRIKDLKKCEDLFGNKKRCRRKSIEYLAKALIEPQIRFRIEKASQNNFKHLQSDIIESFRNLGFGELLVEKDLKEIISLRRCEFCVYNKNMKKKIIAQIVKNIFVQTMVALIKNALNVIKINKKIN